MRPLAALLAILMGSAVALASGLVLTWIVILLLPADEARFAAVTAGSFYGEQRERRWRLGAHAATLAMFAVAVWLYWPK